MEITDHQKHAIRLHYAYLFRLRFHANGMVDAQQVKDGPYGLLYTPAMTERHLKAMEPYKPDWAE